MPIALEITLIIALAAVTIGLLGLFFRLGRTAQGVDAFLVASRADLAQIAGDVHASRLRMDQLAISLQASLDEISGVARLMGDVGRTIKELHNRYQCTLESITRNIAIVIGGISAVLAFFKSRQSPHEHEQENQT